MPYETVKNTTDQPVPIDSEGRTIGGGEFGTILTTEDLAKGAVDDGRLVKVDRPDSDDGLDADARAAFDATDELEQARKKGPDELAETADKVDATKTKRAARASAKNEED